MNVYTYRLHSRNTDATNNAEIPYLLSLLCYLDSNKHQLWAVEVHLMWFRGGGGG